MNSYERKRRICKMIVLVLGILSINNIILTIRNYSYAYFEKNVKTGVKLKITTLDEMPSKYATDYLKKKVVSYADASKSDFGGGLVAIDEDGTLYNEIAGNQTIREYRYTGLNVNNYIYYNCKDNMEQNSTNCEIWRIIGVFKDEDGNEHLKIVRNSVLTRDMFPATFNATIYKIRHEKSGDYAYWNYITGSTSDKNDWATGGLQYWLNAGSDKETKTASDGYMSYLSKNAKDLIEETKYYLGNIVYNKDTAISAYIHERGSATCSGSYDCSGGTIWSGNSATWTGQIALMYPSDYGYTASISNWSNEEITNYNAGARDTSWMYKNANHSIHEWFLSPASSYPYHATCWDGDGYLGNRTIFYDSNGVRPTLYLKSEVKIIDGEGSESKPFVINLG